MGPLMDSVPGVTVTDMADCDVTAVTTRVTVVVCERLPPSVPWIVRVYEPVGVLLAVVTASVDDEVAGFGVNVGVAPLGSPATDRLTELLKPPLGLIDTE